MSYIPKPGSYSQAVMQRGRTIENQLIDDILDMKSGLTQKKKWKVPPYDIVSVLKKRVEDQERHLRDLQRSLEEAEKLTFKEGDAVFHQSWGNCLVKRIFIGDGVSSGIDDTLDGRIVVELITTTGYEIAAASDILPISTATKVLFDEGNKS